MGAGVLDVLVGRVRRFHVLAAVGVARHGSVAESVFEGCLEEGRHIFRLDGNAWASSWSKAGFVSVDADHERLGADEGLVFAPRTELLALFERARVDVGGHANAVLWSTGSSVEEDGSTDRFQLLTHPEEAVFEREPHCLRELFGLETGDLSLAQRLEYDGRSGGAKLSERDVAALLGSSRRNQSAIQADADEAARMLAQAGLAWADPRGAARLHLEGLVGATGSDENALRKLFGAMTNKASGEAVELILSGGVDPSGRASAGINGVREGETPLLLAVKYRDHEVLNALIKAGVDLDARDGGYTALARAVEVRDAAAVRTLIDAGSKMTAGVNGDDSVLRFARYHTDVEIIRILLDAGAPAPTPKITRSLAAIAANSGAADVVARLASL